MNIHDLVRIHIKLESLILNNTEKDPDIRKRKRSLLILCLWKTPLNTAIILYTHTHTHTYIYTHTYKKRYRGIWGEIHRYMYNSLVAQMVKNPSALQETWVQSLGWEDPLEKGMATHPRI